MTPGMLVDSLPEGKKPADCLGCGNCKQVCPQNIDVPEALHKFSELLAAAPSWESISKERAKLHAQSERRDFGPGRCGPGLVRAPH